MISNDEVVGFVEEHPVRLVGIGSVDIARPMRAVAEVRRCVEELGFKGIDVLPGLCELPPTDRLFYPAYAACCELGVPFCTQIGHTGPLMSSEVGQPIYLDRVALDFPELIIVVGHIGYPWTDEAVAVASVQYLHRRLVLDREAVSCAVRRLAPDQRRPQGVVRFQLPDDRAHEGAGGPRRSGAVAGDSDAVPRRERATRVRRVSGWTRQAFPALCHRAPETIGRESKLDLPSLRPRIH